MENLSQFKIYEVKPSPLLRQFPPHSLWVPGVTNDAVLRRGDISLLHAAIEKREDRPGKWRDSEEEVLDCCKLQSENLLFDESFVKNFQYSQPTHSGSLKILPSFPRCMLKYIPHWTEVKSLSISLSHNWDNKKSSPSIQRVSSIVKRIQSTFTSGNPWDF